MQLRIKQELSVVQERLLGIKLIIMENHLQRWLVKCLVLSDGMFCAFCYTGG